VTFQPSKIPAGLQIYVLIPLGHKFFQRGRLLLAKG